MTKEEIFNDIKAIAQEELEVEPDQITLETNIKEDLDADSLDLFEILNEIEDKYDIELETDDKIETMNQLVDFVKEQLDSQK
ncbi:acyl carrier protein [Lactobacillus sp. PV037]|uniref:acyl carrier protein n=1 Tax=unclassified Lactobacillus TaxID=2620435 RepID=UPI00223F1CF1|nr:MULTISPECIES: acyl carrier protein [unclassified Lactobacillus]QNQ82025.1 acyl carrier protein [Lactobacillus sp. PV012]QNQ83940.1 acyl carrier protein [Lactobacillus sp. PV037]